MVEVPDSSEERTIAIILKNLDGMLWQRCPCLLEGRPASLEIHERKFEVELRGNGLQNLSAGRDDFETDAVTGYEA